MQRLEQAIVGLEQVLNSPPRLQQSWRHMVRQRMSGLDDALHEERTPTSEAWLAARASHLHRERDRLLTRLSILGSKVAEATNLEPVRQDLLRLVHDIQHHHQRVNDMAYDAVGLDYGGSE